MKNNFVTTDTKKTKNSFHFHRKMLFQKMAFLESRNSSFQISSSSFLLTRFSKGDLPRYRQKYYEQI